MPNINRLAQAVRDTGGAVVWIKTTYTDETLKSWSTYYEISRPEQNAKRIEALDRRQQGATNCGHDARHAAGRSTCEKKRFSAFIQGSSNLAEVLRERRASTPS